MVKHPPYVEEGNKRKTLQPTKGGIDTSVIDCMRQGISIRNNGHRYCGTQPKIWAGNFEHTLGKHVFGIPGLYPDGDAFNDEKRQIFVEAFINHIASGTALPVGVAFAAAGDDDGRLESFDGAIEPLEIRNVVADPSTADGIHVVSAGRLSLIATQECPLDLALVVSPYIEQGLTGTLSPSSTYTSSLAATSGSNVFWPEQRITRPAPERLIEPFDDSRAATRTIASTLIATGSGREHLAAGLVLLNGITDVGVLARTRPSTAGIVYHDRWCATDSVVFGGLTRYKP